MNVVRITSGLGNQMFQYAFYRALKANSPDTKMDISEFKYRKHHNGYELEKIFNIVPDYATKQECDKLADVSKDFFSEMRRKFLKKKLNCTGDLINEGELGTYFHPELLNKSNSYFQGYWQTEKYFLSIEKEIRADFAFKEMLDTENLNLLEKIKTNNSVSLHVRRGDYVKARRFNAIGSVCTPEYYQRAIEYIQSQIETPHFFVFSDDIEWVKENLILDNAYYVDVNKGKNSYKDLQLMSNCNHNIIANSSFSWWGAWLNNNPEKRVLAPNVWFRDLEMPDIIPDRWLKINVN